MPSGGAQQGAGDDPGSRALTSLLTSLQLADSAFPSGRYTLSHGLEAMVQEHYVTTRGSASALCSLVADQLEHTVGPADGVALAWAHRSVSGAGPGPGCTLPRAVEVDRLLTAVKLAHEPREASRRTGRGLLATAVAVFGGPALAVFAEAVRDGTTPGNGAVVMGLLTAEQRIPVRDAVAVELYAFVAGWVTAAVRLGVADHRVAQALLHRSAPAIERATARACRSRLDEMASSAPLVDVMSMRHERAALRLFTS